MNVWHVSTNLTIGGQAVFPAQPEKRPRWDGCWMVKWWDWHDHQLFHTKEKIQRKQNTS